MGPEGGQASGMSSLLRCALATALFACSSGTPEPNPTGGPDPEPIPETTAEPPPIPEPRADASAPPAGSGSPQSREIMRKDCQALASKYGELVRSDEASKLNPKLSSAQRDTATANIDKAAQALAARFAEGCESSLVGKFAEEAALQCAMSAKRLADFDVCMNGPAAPPAN